MGGVLAALYALRNWGCKAPHLESQFNCSCNNDPSSSSSEEAGRDLRKTTTWLQRHRPPGIEAKKVGAATSHTAAHASKDKHSKKTHTEEK